MIEQLKSAGDQLRVAWDNYYQVYSNIQNYYQAKGSDAPDLSLELSRQLDVELAFLSSHEPKISKIKLSIRRARNYSPGIAPVNSLPPEILTRIFHLLLSWPHELHLLSTDENDHFPKYPDYLAQVCSSWRKIALSSSSLWDHIDLSFHQTFCNGLVARAKRHMARAGQLPIELRIADNGTDRQGDYNLMYQFLGHVSRRLVSVEFVVTSDRFFPVHRNASLPLLRRPRTTFKKFVVRAEYRYITSFIFTEAFGFATNTNAEGDHGWELRGPNITIFDSKEGHVESSLASVTVLHLHGVFPAWYSTAYQGLVDLRMTSTKEWSYIGALDLINILQSSPGLRILHFGIEIEDLTPENLQGAPVYLPDLQVVRIVPAKEDGTYILNDILRFLAPGTKPLRLSLHHQYELKTVAVTELDQFFARSRVAKFYTMGLFPPINMLLRHAANLEVVVLDSFKSGIPSEIRSRIFQFNDSASFPHLESLHILSSSLSEDDLRFFLECCPAGIQLHTTDVKRENNGASEPTQVSAEDLLEAFPTVRITGGFYQSKDPTVDWDLLD
ncbi:hypothetical protein RSAG8_09116, partial [Rhizoctonia solani AG-8 WAC10335]